MTLLSDLIAIIILFIPAAFANLTPVFFSKVKWFRKPISKKYFGSHKTWRGFIFGIVIGIIVTYILSLVNISSKYLLIDFSSNILLIGFLLGLGALSGDLVKSYFKRRKGIKPGKPWLIWDQIDWIIGSWLFISLYSYVKVYYLLIGIVVLGIATLIAQEIAFFLGLKEREI